MRARVKSSSSLYELLSGVRGVLVAPRGAMSSSRLIRDFFLGRSVASVLCKALRAPTRLDAPVQFLRL